MPEKGKDKDRECERESSRKRKSLEANEAITNGTKTKPRLKNTQQHKQLGEQ